jgi:hypothetical protein
VEEMPEAMEGAREFVEGGRREFASLDFLWKRRVRSRREVFFLGGCIEEGK